MSPASAREAKVTNDGDHIAMVDLFFFFSLTTSVTSGGDMS